MLYDHLGSVTVSKSLKNEWKAADVELYPVWTCENDCLR